jgi:nucleoside-diphosphate-sugar epimerase
MHLLIIGAGYTGSVLARRALAAGTTVTATRRVPHELEGCTAIALDLARDRAPAADVTVCCAPPGADPAGEIANLGTTGRLIYVSSTGVYAPGGGAWVDEDWPLDPHTASGHARLAAERALPAHAVILRAAGIYGPGRGIEDRLRAGTYRIVGDGTAHVSRIHVEDLVEAILRAAESTVTGPINCADDDPAAIGELADQLAADLGVPPPPRVAPETVGREIAGMLTADRKISNAKMKRELGVVLRYPSARMRAARST